jgi:hypothetical protein
MFARRVRMEDGGGRGEKRKEKTQVSTCRTLMA